MDTRLFPRSVGSNAKRCALEIDRKVTLRTTARIAVAVTGRTERLLLAGAVREPEVVRVHLQRRHVDADLAVMRRTVANARVRPIALRVFTLVRIGRSSIDVDGIVFRGTYGSGRSHCIRSISSSMSNQSVCTYRRAGRDIRSACPSPYRGSRS